MNVQMIAAICALSIALPAVAQEPGSGLERDIEAVAVGITSAVPLVPVCPTPDGLSELRRSVESNDVVRIATLMGAGGCAMLVPGSFGLTARMNDKRMAMVSFFEAGEKDIFTNAITERQHDKTLWVYVSHLVPLDESLPPSGIHNIWVETFAEQAAEHNKLEWLDGGSRLGASSPGRKRDQNLASTTEIQADAPREGGFFFMDQASGGCAGMSRATA